MDINAFSGYPNSFAQATRRSQKGCLSPSSLLYREEGNPASAGSQLLDPFPEFQPTSPEVPGHRLYDELPAELRIMIVDQMVAEATDAVITIRVYGLMKLLVKKTSAIVRNIDQF